MPLESITCAYCRSSEASEYKPGSFICSHCDGVFKHFDPAKHVPEAPRGGARDKLSLSGVERPQLRAISA